MLFKFLRFRTLQSRFTILLLGPVFFIILLAGICVFVYTRNLMLHQWNESAVLKLQRAAHHLEMEVMKPIELVEIFLKTNGVGNTRRSQQDLIEVLASLKDVVRVGFSHINHGADLQTGKKGRHHGNLSMEMFRSGRILTITQPRYDADAGQETVTLIVSLLDSRQEAVGILEIMMSFKDLLKDIFDLGWWQSDMACIVDKEGRYIVHTNMSMKGRKKLGETNDALEVDLLSEIKANGFGTLRSKEHPPERVAGFYTLKSIPWTIILFAKGDRILKPMISYRNAFILGSIILILAVIVLIRLNTGSLVKQIEGLSRHARNVAQGNYGNPLLTDSRDEIGNLINSYNEMVEGLKQRDFIRDSFGRYVDPEFAKVLLEHPEAGKLGGQRREVAILMSDIRGFTALSETLSPEIIVQLLNQYFSHMIKVIQKHNGIIVDFFGDAILVFFESFTGSADAMVKRSVDCALDMQRQMKAFNRGMALKNMPCLEMGIGINAGQVIVGNTGSETRAKYGIVGSAVNVTSRIQEMAKAGEIIVSESVCSRLGNSLEISRSFSAALKGLDQPIRLAVLKLNSIPTP